MPRTDAAAALPPSGLRERRKASTRQALVDSALRLMAARGVAEVTVEDICAEVEVSPRTFFRYFAGKEQVLAEPVSAMLARIQTDLRAQPRALPVWDAIREALLAGAPAVQERAQEFVRVSVISRRDPTALAASAGVIVDFEHGMRSEIEQRLGPGADPLDAPLLLGLAMVGYRAALETWADAGAVRDVADQLGEALDRLTPAVGALLRR